MFVLDYLIQLSSKEDCLTVECKFGKHFFSDVLKDVIMSVSDVLVLAYYFPYIHNIITKMGGEETYTQF